MAWSPAAATTTPLCGTPRLVDSGSLPPRLVAGSGNGDRRALPDSMDAAEDADAMHDDEDVYGDNDDDATTTTPRRAVTTTTTSTTTDAAWSATSPDAAGHAPLLHAYTPRTRAARLRPVFVVFVTTGGGSTAAAPSVPHVVLVRPSMGGASAVAPASATTPWSLVRAMRTSADEEPFVAAMHATRFTFLGVPPAAQAHTRRVRVETSDTHAVAPFVYLVAVSRVVLRIHARVVGTLRQLLPADVVASTLWETRCAPLSAWMASASARTSAGVGAMTLRVLARLPPEALAAVLATEKQSAHARDDAC